MKIQVAGADVFCDTGGNQLDNALPTVVFIHGALNDHSVWAPQVAGFACAGANARFNALAPDLPGHGDSAGPALHSIEALADWTVALLDAAAIEDAVLVGHSMGSLIALEVAFRSPARVRKVALLGTAFPMKVSDALLATALEDEQRAIDMVSQWSHSASANWSASLQPGVDLVDRSRQLMRRLSAANADHLLHTDLSACNTYANGDAAAKSLRCPALFIIGSADKMTPARAAAGLIAAIPHAQVVTLNAGHAMMQEQPEAASAALLAFAEHRH
jgi:pimeloyl-ACP methyl ester carboxylesterase